jgi:hypothetical protein
MTSDADHLTLEEYKKEFASNVHQMSITVRNLAVRMTQLTGWHENQTMAFESLAANILKQYIIKLGITTGVTEEHIIEMPRNYTKIDQKKYKTYFGDTFSRGVEWDGALFVNHPTTPKMTLYLIEAKTTIETSDVREMTDRINRTQKFIDLCCSKELPGPNAPCQLQALCAAWSEWGLPEQIRGVVLAHNFTTDMLQVAKEGEITCIYIDGSAYVVNCPWLPNPIIKFDQIDTVNFSRLM